VDDGAGAAAVQQKQAQRNLGGESKWRRVRLAQQGHGQSRQDGDARLARAPSGQASRLGMRATRLAASSAALLRALPAAGAGCSHLQVTQQRKGSSEIGVWQRTRTPQRA
jgi:hypothetical protein